MTYSQLYKAVDESNVLTKEMLNIFKELDTSKVQTIQLDDSHNNLYYLSYLATEIVEVEDMKIVII